jgi:hypothetical protein
MKFHLNNEYRAMYWSRTVWAYLSFMALFVHTSELFLSEVPPVVENLYIFLETNDVPWWHYIVWWCSSALHLFIILKLFMIQIWCNFFSSRAELMLSLTNVTVLYNIVDMKAIVRYIPWSGLVLAWNLFYFNNIFTNNITHAITYQRTYDCDACFSENIALSMLLPYATLYYPKHRVYKL